MHASTAYQYYLTPRGWIPGREEVEGNTIEHDPPADAVAVYEFRENGEGLYGHDETSWRCIGSDGSDHEDLLSLYGLCPRCIERKRQTT